MSLSLLFNVIFFSKYQTIRHSVQAQQTSLQEQLQETQETDAFASHAAVIYTENFLTTYITIPADEQGRKKRLENLQTFYAQGFDVSRLGAVETFSGSRELQSLRYLETVPTSATTADLHFLVTSTITDASTEEAKENSLEKEEEIVVSLATDGSGYAVTKPPRLTKSDLQGEVKLPDPAVEGEAVSTTERKQLTAFLEKFFTSYGVSDETMPFMAAVEKGLTGQVFESLVLRQLGKKDGVLTTVVDVTYREENTSLASVYTYALVVEPDDGTFFITSIQ
nr:conjugal transfer protein [Thalassobacillus pellis]